MTVLLLQIKDEEALMRMFGVIETIHGSRHASKLSKSLYELVETMIKDALFRIREEENISRIIGQMGFLSSDKNEEYRTAQLLWTISDHLKTLSQQGHPPAE